MGVNPNVSPNQFALPGMEHISHAGAPFLAEGVKFHTSTDYTYSNTPSGADWRAHKEPHEHSLIAFGKTGQTVGELHWAGSGQHRRSASAGHYPGEVTWVGRPETRAEDIYRDEKEGVWKRKEPLPHRGIMTAMFHMGHQVNMGQSTVPVHSADRTAAGEMWSEKVGSPELRPRHYDFSWRPPAGIHPYEQHNLQPQQFEPGPGQGELFKGDRYDKEPF